jgi:hypothetical protein
MSSYEALKADPASGISLDDARAALRERHARLTAG